MWSDSQIIRKCGCGIIAAYDVSLYLMRKHNPESFYLPSRDEYCRKLHMLKHNGFPLLYPTGINGLLMVNGMNKLFRCSALPYHASLSVSRDHLLDRIIDMLINDIPVILAIGPNFPRFWDHNGLPLYRQVSEGVPPSCRTTGHYVVVTELSDDILTISSWGKKFHIRYSEYRDYMIHHSSYLFSNIILIKKK